MEAPMLYRPNSRKPSIVPLLAAPTIEGSAILIAGIHQSETAVGSTTTTDPGIDLVLVPTEFPPQTELPPEERDRPPLVAPNDYSIEEPLPPPPRRTEKTRAQDRVLKRSGIASAIVGIQSPNPMFISAPPPAYSYEMRRSRAIGSVLVKLDLNPATGEITNVTLAQASGSALLDSASLATLRRWRAKAGGPSMIVVPIT